MNTRGEYVVLNTNTETCLQFKGWHNIPAEQKKHFAGLQIAHGKTMQEFEKRANFDKGSLDGLKRLKALSEPLRDGE
jgi:hypothetical protein